VTAQSRSARLSEAPGTSSSSARPVVVTEPDAQLGALDQGLDPARGPARPDAGRVGHAVIVPQALTGSRLLNFIT